MKIIIEVAGGCVSGVYYKRQGKFDGYVPEVFVVDLDGAELGKRTKAVKTEVETLTSASAFSRNKFKN